MSKELSLDELWAWAPPAGRAFRSDSVSGLPDAARRYLEHAIAPQTPLASAVRLRMHGEIKLKRWLPFGAEQVIHRDRGMIWSAAVRMHGIPILGSDRCLDGEGAMRWKLGGLVAVLSASGPDISKSAVGRVLAESVWLPSIFCGDGASWSERDGGGLVVRFTAYGVNSALALTVDQTGRLESVRLPRWGNPEGGAFREIEFGALVEEEQSFAGYTIPTRLRVGWYFGSARFEPEGEFFRARIDEATFR